VTQKDLKYYLNLSDVHATSAPKGKLQDLPVTVWLVHCKPPNNAQLQFITCILAI